MRLSLTSLSGLVKPGNTKGRSITVLLTSCLTGLDQSVLQIKTKIVSCHTADSKPVKQEVNGTVIHPLYVFPGLRFQSKSGAHPRGVFFRCPIRQALLLNHKHQVRLEGFQVLYSRVGFWLYPQTLEKLTGTNTPAYYKHSLTYRCKKFYEIDTWYQWCKKITLIIY